MRLLIAAATGFALLPAAMSGADAPASATPPGPICGAHAPGTPPAAQAKADASAPASAQSGPDWTSAPPEPAEALLTGYGTGGFSVHTKSPEAQAFFDNGMQLGHAFAHKASVAAFRKAEALDPDCAMCVWGEAWARGPTINFGVDDKTQAQLAILADRAAALAKDGPPIEKALTAAMQLRYRKGGGGGPGDDAYARAMDQIARDHPADNELAVLAADAWMIPAANRWQFGPNSPNLMKALGLLGAVLTRAPNDTGAIHFYIHATEMAGAGAQALPYAERLQALAPAASHLVHMPSHTYFWVGKYPQALRANLDAAAIDEANAARLKTPGGVWDLPYHAHNVMFGIGAALMDGDGKAALELARPVIARSAKDAGFAQVADGRAYFAMGRFADEAEIKALADPGPSKPYLQAMWRYARGEEAARRGEARQVRAEAAGVVLDPAAAKAFGSSQANAEAIVKIARLVLEGRADMLDHKPDDAAKAFGEAAALQEKALGSSTDPPAFWYPVRRSLADAEFVAGRPADAMRDARKTLSHWAGDPVTLVVLAQAQAAQGDAASAAKTLSQVHQAWPTGKLTIGEAGA
jgi:hypothetical protein